MELIPYKILVPSKIDLKLLKECNMRLWHKCIYGLLLERKNSLYIPNRRNFLEIP